jgi:hypothetical protein
MNLRPIDEHCARLAEAVSGLTGCVNAYEWLLAGAAIESVQINSTKHDWRLVFESDWHYAEAQGTLLERFIEAFSVFSMVWGALEAVLDMLNLPPHPDKTRRGKISDACYHLHNEYKSRSITLGLREEVQSFIRCANACLGFDSVEARYFNGRDLGHAAIGLYIIYELRNQFAHGSMALPLPDEDFNVDYRSVSLVTHATRITLIQIQMLLLAHFKYSEERGEYWWFDGCAWYDDVPLSVALTTLHVALDEESPQLRLFE